MLPRSGGLVAVNHPGTIVHMAALSRGRTLTTATSVSEHSAAGKYQSEDDDNELHCPFSTSGSRALPCTRANGVHTTIPIASSELRVNEKPAAARRVYSAESDYCLD